MKSGVPGASHRPDVLWSVVCRHLVVVVGKLAFGKWSAVCLFPVDHRPHHVTSAIGHRMPRSFDIHVTATDDGPAFPMSWPDEYSGIPQCPHYYIVRDTHQLAYCGGRQSGLVQQLGVFDVNGNPVRHGSLLRRSRSAAVACLLFGLALIIVLVHMLVKPPPKVRRTGQSTRYSVQSVSESSNGRTLPFL